MTRLMLPLLLVAISADVAAATLFAVGEARARPGGEFAYREYHCDLAEGPRRVVRYEAADGELIATKSIDFSSGRTTPSFAQRNLLQRRSVELDYAGDRLVSRNGDAAGVEEAEIDFDPGRPLVIDAGFDEFIRANWVGLVRGDDARFQFPLASEGSLVELRIEPAACSGGDDSNQCFALEPSNWLFRLLAGSAELGYDPESRRLMRFSGRSNLPDRNGKGFDVDIVYRYDLAEDNRCTIAAETSG